MKMTVAGCAMLLAGVAMAAPVEKPEIVAPGFVGWTGVTDKNHLGGRLLVPADLRQKTLVFIQIDGTKMRAQLNLTGALTEENGLHRTVGEGSATWERMVLPRDVLVVYSIVGAGPADPKAYNEILGKIDPEKDRNINMIFTGKASVYRNLKGTGIPDGTGKYPFVCVMPREGIEPLYRGTFNAKTTAEVRKAISAERKKISDDGLVWRPYYGYVAEPKHVKVLPKLLKAGKPVKGAMAELHKGVLSRDSETANECQMILDAVEQTRSDLVFRIQLEARACPHRAAYDIGVLVKGWPQEKKHLADIASQINSNPEIQPLIRIFPKLLEWSDPEFKCKPSEAKKILQEINKVKKQLAVLKESKNVTVQNGAMLIESELDTLSGTISAFLPSK